MMIWSSLRPATIVKAAAAIRLNVERRKTASENRRDSAPVPQSLRPQAEQMIPNKKLSPR
jgi:hypothetical protein